MEEALGLRGLTQFEKRNRLVERRRAGQWGCRKTCEKFVIGGNGFGPFMGHQVGVADQFGALFGPRSLWEEKEIASGLGNRPVILAGGEKFGAELPDLLLAQVIILRGEVVGV